MKSFSRRLRELREAAGLSIPELAKKADVVPQTIHKLENGERSPGFEVVRRLSAALPRRSLATLAQYSEPPIDLATSQAASPSISATMTALAPSAAKRLHRARPMPLAPPVTMTTLSWTLMLRW